MNRPAGPDALRAVPTAAAVALSVVTALVVGRLFDGDAYLRPAIALVVGVHAVALALRWSRLHPAVALPALAALTAVLYGVVLYRSTLYGPFPTGATLDAVGTDLRTVIDNFRTAVAPVPDTGAFASVTTMALGAAAALSDTFAFRARGRVEAVVPHGVLFVLVAVLANDATDYVTAAVWSAAALFVVATVRFGDWSAAGAVGGRRVGWVVALPPMLVVVGLSAVVAGATAPRLPGVEAAPLLDPGSGGDSVTEVVSPLIGIGSRLTSGGSSELFTVSSSDGPHYWRAMALDDFDGANWSPSPESLTRVDDSAASAMGDTNGSRVDQVVTVTGLAGHLVPAAHVATSVSPDSVLFAPRSQSLVMPDVELRRGDVFTVRSRVLQPTITQLRSTTVAGAPSLSMYTVPAAVPQSVRDDAVEVTRDSATPYDRAIALQDWFRSTGGFTYDVDVDYGNGPGAVADFLDRRAGFCQQFATTYAVMARSIGLAARVVVGFTPGDLDTSGTYHVFGRHAHAWPEVWFDGLGWVAFEPTPGRGSPDGVGYQPGVTPAQDDSGTAAIDPGTTAPTSTSSTVPVTSDTTTTTTTPSDAVGVTTTPTASAPDGSSHAGTMVAVLVAAVCASGVVVARRRARQRHDHDDPARAVALAWATASRDLRLLGARAAQGATPVEFAAAAATTGVDPTEVDELARLVTRAVYSPSPVDGPTARRSTELAARIHAASLAAATPLTRLRARLADLLARPTGVARAQAPGR